MKYKLIFLDTETTGGESGDRFIQLAYKFPGQTYDEMFDELFKPDVKIQIEAMAVHHITEQMIADKPDFPASEYYEPVKALLEDDQSVVIAHNAPFDVGMLRKEQIEPALVIDTLRIARHLDPEGKVKSHAMQYLRYLLELDKDITEKIIAHDAKGDVIVLELLFNRLSARVSAMNPDLNEDEIIEKMIAMTNEPSLIPKFRFGKHNGKAIKKVATEDPGYLRWLLAQKEQSPEGEEDWIHTLKYFLNT